MASKNSHCRVMVSVDSRSVIITLLDGTGERLEEEHFSLVHGADDINPRAVATDVFHLLYQCANDAVNGEED